MVAVLDRRLLEVRIADVSPSVALSLPTAEASVAVSARVLPVTTAVVSAALPSIASGPNRAQRTTVSSDLVPMPVAFANVSHEFAVPAVAVRAVPLSALNHVFAPLKERAQRLRDELARHSISDPPRSDATVDDFFPIDEPEPIVPESQPPESTVEAVRDTLVEDLATEFERFHGVESLRRIFCRLLGYGHVYERVRLDMFSASQREFVRRVEVFAEHEGIQVLLVRLSAGVNRRRRATIVERLGDRFPAALILLTNPSCSRVWLGWAGDGAETDLRLLRCVPFEGAAEVTARRFADLFAFDPSDNARTAVELLARFEMFFDEVEPEELPDPDVPVLSVEALFYRELVRHPLMNHEETTNLLKEIDTIPVLERTDTRQAEYLHLRNQIVMGHLRLGFYAVRREGLRARIRSLTVFDLVQATVRGLCTAIERFDLTRRVRFGTYAFFHVRQVVQRAFQNTDSMIRVPSHAHAELRRCWGVAGELHANLGRQPSPDTIANAVSTDKRNHIVISRAWRALVCAPSTGHAKRMCPCSGLAAPTDDLSTVDLATPVEQTEATSRRLLQAFMGANIPARTRRVLELRNGIGSDHEHTLREIGEILGLTRERVRQIEEKGLNKLREWFEREGFEGPDL